MGGEPVARDKGLIEPKGFSFGAVRIML